MSTYKTPEEMDAAAAKLIAEAKMLSLQAQQEREKQKKVSLGVQNKGAKRKPDWLDNHVREYQDALKNRQLSK
jgi:hypothetical protein